MAAMLEASGKRIKQAFAPRSQVGSWNGGQFLFYCNSLMYETFDHPTPDYNFVTCQFAENMREFYKAQQLDVQTLRLSALVANTDRAMPLTVAMVPLNFENFNAITREAAVLKNFNHCNIARYSNITFKGNFILLEMSACIRLSELLEGSRREAIDKCHNNQGDQVPKFGFPEAPVAKITRAVLDGLEYVHRRGVWHSKMSTDCIMLGLHDKKITISGWMALKPTKHHIQKAPTLNRFMAPEQALRTLEGRKFTASSMKTYETRLTEKVDIWSVGIIICEMVLGRSVYGSVDLNELARLIFEMKYPSFEKSAVTPTSSTLDQIIGSCLNRSTSDRESASDIIQKHSKYFVDFLNTKNVIDECIVDEFHLTFLTTNPGSFAFTAAQNVKPTKFSFIKNIEFKMEKLKWQRYREKRVNRNRGLSIETGGHHICIRIRDEFTLFSTFTPFKYVDAVTHPDNPHSVYLLQDAVMSLTKSRFLTYPQAFKVCTLIAQLAQMSLAIDEEASDVIADDIYWGDTYSILRIMVPLKDMPEAVLQHDWTSLYYSLLIEFTYSPQSEG